MSFLQKSFFRLSVHLVAANLCLYFLYNEAVSRKIKNYPMFAEVMEWVKKNPGALHYIGEPIQEEKAKFSGEEIKVYVTGPKSNGIVFFSVVDNEEHKMSLGKIELQIGKDDSKRLIIKPSSINKENPTGS